VSGSSKKKCTAAVVEVGHSVDPQAKLSSEGIKSEKRV